MSTLYADDTDGQLTHGLRRALCSRGPVHTCLPLEPRQVSSLSIWGPLSICLMIIRHQKNKWINVQCQCIKWVKKIIIQQVKGSAGMIHAWLLRVWLLQHHHQAVASLPFLFVHFPSLQAITTLRQSKASSTARRGLKAFVPEKAWVFKVRATGWRGLQGSVCSPVSVISDPHNHARSGKVRQLQLPQNLSRATVIEINWIWEIITFMLICVLRGDNSGR